ncbi:hypothetical protein FRC0474_02189 [Corynebacterium diphtheriae]|nr:hypothetical protein FRC0474_02189 [Corynebacterium diphtheriae]
MPPGLGQVPIGLLEYVTVFGGITPGSFFNRDRNKPYRSQRLVPLSFRMAGTDINIARSLGWTGYESSAPWGGTANNVMCSYIGTPPDYFLTGAGICHTEVSD